MPLARSSSELKARRDHVAESRADAGPHELANSPESFAKGMKGTFSCIGSRCRAGREVCVYAPDDKPAHCEPISRWLGHWTPQPVNGFPDKAGVVACDDSKNCPEGSVCCVHLLGTGEAQTSVCHAKLDECAESLEVCNTDGGVCRTPGTVCVDQECKRDQASRSR